jgi:hypothetical protein
MPPLPSESNSSSPEPPHGGDDVDELYGGSGADTLFGDAGSDTLGAARATTR